MAYRADEADATRVRSEVRRFKENVLVYIAVMGVLVLANILAGGLWYAHFWLFWIALGWGVFIALQGVRLFGDDIGRRWEDRMVDHLMARRRSEPGQAGAAPRAQPSPPPRPPTPSWPPSSSSAPRAGSEPPPAPEQAIVTPPPGHDPLLPPPQEPAA